MDYSFLDHPDWKDVPEEKKKPLIGSYIDDQLNSDPEWSSIPEDKKPLVRDSYVNEAYDLHSQMQREYDKTHPAGLTRRLIGDPLVSLGKGVVGTADAAIGLADYATGGHAGKLAEDLGYDSEGINKSLESLYSPQQREINKGLQEAQGFWPTLKYAVQNPSVVTHSVLESAPAMVASGGIARGLLGAAPKAMTAIGGVAGRVLGMAAEDAAPVIAGGIGEGAVQAGQAAEEARRSSEDKLLSAKQAALSGASGLLDALIVLGSGKVADKLGITDIEKTLIAGKHTRKIVDKEGKEVNKGFLRGALESAINEGILQELPQSAQEQILQNLSQNKPWDEGVGQASVMGMLSGMVMGGGESVHEGVKDRFGRSAQQPVTPPAQEPNPANIIPPTDAAGPTGPVPPATHPVTGDITRDILGVGDLSPEEVLLGRVPERTAPRTDREDVLAQDMREQLAGRAPAVPYNVTMSGQDANQFLGADTRGWIQDLNTAQENLSERDRQALRDAEIERQRRLDVELTGQTPEQTAQSENEQFAEWERKARNGSYENLPAAPGPNATQIENEDFLKWSSKARGMIYADLDRLRTERENAQAEERAKISSQIEKRNKQLQALQDDIDRTHDRMMKANQESRGQRGLPAIQTQEAVGNEQGRPSVLSVPEANVQNGTATQANGEVRPEPLQAGDKVSDGAQTGTLFLGVGKKLRVKLDKAAADGRVNVPLTDGWQRVGEKPQAVSGESDKQGQPWEMTPDEYVNGAKNQDEIAVKKSFHPKLVKEALAEGKDVPENVLMAYRHNVWAQEALEKKNAAITSEQDASAEPQYPIIVKIGNKNHTLIGIDKNGNNLYSDNKTNRRYRLTEDGKIRDDEPYNNEQTSSWLTQEEISKLERKSVTSEIQAPKYKLGDMVVPTTESKLSDRGPGKITHIKESYTGTQLIKVDGYGGAHWKAYNFVAHETPSGETQTKEQSTSEPQKAESPKWGSSNKIFTEDRANRAREILRKKLGQLNAGIDPEILAAGIDLAGYHIEAGARKFTDFAQRMIQDLGDAIRPYLKSFYNAVRDYPGIDNSEMTEHSEVSKTDVNSININNGENANADLHVTGSSDQTASENDRGSDTGKSPESVPGSEASRNAEGVRPESGTGNDANLQGRVEPDLRSGSDEGKPGPNGKASGHGTKAKGSVGVGDRNVSGISERAGKERKRSKAGTDYVIPEGGLARQGGWKSTAKANLDAIELLKKIQSENRPATKEEQEVLSKYVGWGSSELANNMFPGYARMGEVLPNWQHDAGWKALSERLVSLLSPEEIAQAARSTKNAHYTSESVVRSIYKILDRLGFKGGKILEPGTGIGNFVGLAPESVREKSIFTGVERDPITAGIAKLLYPQQNILNEDFVKQQLPRDFFDGSFGNPPFGSTTIIADPEYRKNGFKLHNYFFAKSIDRVRPGGLLVFVTSRYTMDSQGDKARQYLSDRADLIGAVRLPQTAFKENAGTDVVTDILFLRKRLPGEQPSGEKWAGLADIKAGDGTAKINEYYANHPEMVLGRNSLEGTMYAKNSYTVLPYDENIDKLFAEAEKRFPENIYSEKTKSTRAERQEVVERDMNPTNKKQGGIYLSDKGEVMIVDYGTGVPIDTVKFVSNKDKEWLKSYVPLRDALKQSHYAQITDDPAWESKLKDLQKEYKRFVKKHGRILDFEWKTKTEKDEEGNPRKTDYIKLNNERLWTKDVDGTLVTTLERITDDGSIVETNVLSSRTLKPPVQADIKNINDALAVSLNENGKLDLDHVSSLIDMPKDNVIETLGDLIYENPEGGQYEMSDEYLSGNVVRKLDVAIQAAENDPKYQRNVDALKNVQPKALPASRIQVNLGSGWVPTDYYAQFAEEVLGISGANINHHSTTNLWTVSSQRGEQYLRGSSNEWSTADRGANEILKAVLNNNTPIKITRTEKDSTGTRTWTDQQATDAANEIANRMKEKFKSWVWEDGDRAAYLVDTFNTRFNNLVRRKFNGSHLTLPGVSMNIKLHDHQKDVIWRILQTGNTYLAHAVGAGKTYVMISSGMEMKRLGMIRKPIYVVPKHMLAQFSREFNELYPNANILVADEENFHTENRRRFIAKATMNAPDAIIMTHSSFKLLKMREENIRPVRDEFLSMLRDSLDEAQSDEEGNRFLIKRIESRIEQAEQRFDSMIADGDKNVTFEDMGADFLFLDEAHEFRKLDFVTNISAKGIAPVGSMGAMGIYIKSMWLDKQNPGRSKVFASGTPITNTMGELYTIQRFFDPEGLVQDGTENFDAWASQYGSTEVDYEPNAVGKPEPVARFVKFVNMQPLSARISQFMDTLTSTQLKSRLNVPDIKGGSPELVVVPPSPEMNDWLKTVLARRLEASKNFKPSKEQPGNPDPIMNINNDGRLAAIDMRFINPNAENNPNSKLNKFIDTIIETYNETKDMEFNDPATGQKSSTRGGSQICFFNVGFGEGIIAHRGFDSRKWLMGRLKNAGIPVSQVAWMSDYAKRNAAEKEALFKDVRKGKIRILIGSAKQMGTGVNAQTRLTHLNYMDAPWYPSDFEQPIGRIVRQGNQNKEVSIKMFATKGSYDSNMWGLVSRKSKMIESFFDGDPDMDTVEDISSVSPYEIASAMTSGDNRAVKLMKLKNEIGRLENLQANHYESKTKFERDKKSKESSLAYNQQMIPVLDAAKKKVEGSTSFVSGSIDGKLYDDKTKTDFGKDILLKQSQIAWDNTDSVEHVVGEIKTNDGSKYQIITKRASDGSYPLYAKITDEYKREIYHTSFGNSQYVFSTEEGWQPVKSAQNIEIVPWMKTFFYKSNEEVHIVDQATGRTIGSGAKLDAARNAATQFIDKNGKDKILAITQKHLESQGQNPSMEELFSKASRFVSNIISGFYGIDRDLSRTRELITSTKDEIQKLDKRIRAPFEYSGQLAERRVELRQLEEDLAREGEDANVVSESMTEQDTAPPEDQAISADHAVSQEQAGAPAAGVGKYYTKNGLGEYTEIRGARPVNTSDIPWPVDLFAHKEKNDWIITERQTGARILIGKTLSVASEAAIERIKDMGQEAYESSIKTFMGEHGVTPAFQNSDIKNISYSDTPLGAAPRRFGAITPSRATKEFQDIIDRAKASGVVLRFLRSPSEIEHKGLNKTVTDYEAEQGKTIKGFYHDAFKEIYIFTDRVKNMSDLARVVAHELVGHRGLYEFMGKDLNPFLDYLSQHPKYADEVRKTAEKRDMPFADTMDKRAAAKEYFAELVEYDKVTPTLWTRIAVAIKNAMRRMGFKSEWLTGFTDSDLAEIVRGSWNAVEKGSKVGAEQPGRMALEMSPDYSVDGYAMPEDLMNDLRNIHKDVDAFLSMKNNVITLSELQMPKSIRNQGIGSSFMQKLVDYADKNGMKIALTAAGDFGGTKAGQERFYKRFGFVQNKGRNKDYRINENMIRYPVEDSGVDYSDVSEAGASPKDIAAARKAWAEKGTDSPWFKKWFGDSKVVDENGKPLVVYHGTSADFNAFKKSKYGSVGPGIYFTTNKDIAESHGDRIIPAYVKIENNKDGIIAGHEVVVYKPENIKSAIGNRGTFSPESPRIDFSDTPAGRKNREEATSEINETVKPYVKFLKEKADTTVFDRMLSLPMHYFNKVPQLLEAYEAGKQYVKDKFNNQRQLLYNKDGVSYTTFQEDFKKKNPKEYEGTLKPYLLSQDVWKNGYRIDGDILKGFKVYSPTSRMVNDKRWTEWPSVDGEFKTRIEAREALLKAEMDHYIENGGSQEGAEILRTFRQTGFNMFDMLYAPMQNMINDALLNGKPMPSLVIKDEKTGKIEQIDFKTAMAQMGDLEGSYFPRKREPGKYVLRATKDGENPIREHFDIAVPFGSKENEWRRKIPIPINLKAKEYEAKGYNVTIEKTDKLPESVFLDMAGKTMALDAIMNQAIKNMGESTTTSISDLGIKTKWTTKPDGTKVFTLYGGGVKVDQHLDILHDLGGQYHYVSSRKGGYPSIVFEKATEKTEQEIKERLIHFHMIEPLTEAIMAESMLTEVADLFKARGARSSMIQRGDQIGKEVWKGYEEDPITAFTRTSMGIAGATAKGVMAKRLIDIQTGRTESWSEYKDRILFEGGRPNYRDYLNLTQERRIDPAKQPNAYQDLNTYVRDMLRNDEQIDRIVGTAHGIAALKYLAFKVSSAVINMTSLATSVPAAFNNEAKIPFAKSFQLLGKAMGDYRRFAFDNGKGLDNWTKEAFKAVVENGWDQQQFNHEAMSALKNKFGKKYESFMKYAMFAFGITEQINRMSTHIAAYQGIKENMMLENGGMWTAKMQDDALQKAHTISDLAHGDYSKGNQPMFTRGGSVASNVARSAYIFKMFQHNYLLAMKKMGWNDRNYKAAAWMAISPMILAGGGAGVFTPIISMLLKGIGVGGDDPEESFYKWIESEFGYTPSALARTGLIGMGGHGPSLSGSMDINVLQYPKNIYEFLGAPGGVAKDLIDGFKEVQKGNWLKASERFMPVQAAAGPIKAYREATEGITTGKNTPVFYGAGQLKLQGMEPVLRALSFNPARVAMIREKQYAEKQAEAAMQEELNNIYARAKKMFLSPYSTSSEDMAADIIARMEDYNNTLQKNPELARTPLTWKRIMAGVKRSMRPTKRERMRQVSDEEQE